MHGLREFVVICLGSLCSAQCHAQSKKLSEFCAGSAEDGGGILLQKSRSKTRLEESSEGMVFKAPGHPSGSKTDPNQQPQVLLASVVSAPAARSSNMFARLADLERHTSLNGEFHKMYSSRESITDLLQSDKCKHFYWGRANFYMQPPSPTIVDHVSRLFRPAAEVQQSGSELEEPSLPSTPFKRTITYEDVAFPMDFHDGNVTGTTGTPEVFHKERYCEMFAIRTPQRPVKVITAQGENNLTMPAIWKVASTSLTAMLGDASRAGSVSGRRLIVRGPHDGFNSTPPNPLEQSEKHTTFHQDAKEANVKAAIVRSPLDRFLASVYEHGAWSTCTANGTSGHVCDQMIAGAKRMAVSLANDFPHRYRSCAHPSQVYFLSATDLYGEPYVWDQVIRLEELEVGLSQLKGMTGIQLSKHIENSSGEESLKKKYFDAIFSDLATLCSVCKVYAQDFECLGYAKPDQCTQDECAKVGVSLELW